MKSTFYFLIVAFIVISCGERTPSNNKDKEIGESNDNNITGNLEAIDKINVSFQTLKNLLANKEPITNDYLLDSIQVYSKSLSEHKILNETDNYLLVEASGGETGITNYYLISFSKKTGKLIDYIPLGQMAEGVDPSKIMWESSTSFSTVDYQYELLEDEESGAYVQGALLDSIVQSYKINPNGLITSAD